MFNEEQSRHHVENEMTSIEQRIAEIVNDFKTKYEQEIVAAKTDLELQINAAKRELKNEWSSTKASLEQESNATKNEREINATKLSLDQ